MNLEAHPNLHAAGLARDIQQAILGRLRGKAAANPQRALQLAQACLTDFVVQLSCALDAEYGVEQRRWPGCPNCGSETIETRNDSASGDPLFTDVHCAKCGRYLRPWNTV